MIHLNLNKHIEKKLTKIHLEKKKEKSTNYTFTFSVVVVEHPFSEEAAAEQPSSEVLMAEVLS